MTTDLNLTGLDKLTDILLRLRDTAKPEEWKTLTDSVYAIGHLQGLLLICDDILNSSSLTQVKRKKLQDCFDALYLTLQP